MYQGQLVFTQLMDHLPRRTFRRLVERYGGNHRVRSFTCWHQFACMTFAQLTFRESLRDIEACLRAVPEKLYPLGLPGGVARNTLAVANEKQDWRMYAEFAHKVIAQGRKLCAEADLGLELDQTVYALDSTTIELCPSLFPWARMGRDRGSVKLHTLLDLQRSIPANLWITTASFADNRILDVLLPEPGSIYIMDRGYLDFAWLAYLDRARAVFVVRAKANLKFRRLYSHPVDRSTGLVCDQTIVLIAIVRKRLGIELHLYTFLQILSVYVFEKVPLPQLLTGSASTLESGNIRNQLWLFDL